MYRLLRRFSIGRARLRRCCLRPQPSAFQGPQCQLSALIHAHNLPKLFGKFVHFLQLQSDGRCAIIFVECYKCLKFHSKSLANPPKDGDAKFSV